jgi:hypothetical protein
MDAEQILKKERLNKFNFLNSGSSRLSRLSGIHLNDANDVSNLIKEKSQIL